MDLYKQHKKQKKGRIFTWFLVEKIEELFEQSNSSSNQSILFLNESISSGLANDSNTKYPVPLKSKFKKKKKSPLFTPITLYFLYYLESRRTEVDRHWGFQRFPCLKFGLLSNLQIISRGKSWEKSDNVHRCTKYILCQVEPI